MTFYRNLIFVTLCVFLGGCFGYPNSVRPINNFDAPKYMGTWYEVARLDHSFERGLSNVSASYRLEDGIVKIVNKGYSKKQKKWEIASGEAVFANSQDEGYLHVSFFGPFSSTYLVFELGESYEYAFVCGPNTDYLWLLSRSPIGNEKIIEHFVESAKQKGFKVDELIYVKHDRP